MKVYYIKIYADLIDGKIKPSNKFEEGLKMEFRNAEYYFKIAERAKKEKLNEETEAYLEVIFDIVDKAAELGKFYVEYEPVCSEKARKQIVFRLKSLGFVVYDFLDKLRVEWEKD